MIYDEQNIFAKILRDEIPCEKILETNDAISFNDISPKAKVHVLVIPKGAYLDIYDFNKNASQAETVDFWRCVNLTIEKFEIEKLGFQIKSHKGETGGQEVFHFHIHILSND